MSRVLVLAGGSPHAHDFARTGAALAEVLADQGHDTEVVADPDAAATRLTDPTLPAIDVLVINGLWWQMLGEAYDHWRDEHGYSPPPATRAALTAHVHNGGGLVAIHTTSICFDDWPEWREIVGGAWRWGVSSHPPYGPVRARFVADHLVVTGLGDHMQLCDEVYGDLDVCDDVEVLAVAKRDPDDRDQPVVWAHHFGRGRVVYDGFGHDAESILHPQNRRLINQAVSWVGAVT